VLQRYSNPNPLYFVKADLVLAAIVQAGGAGALVVRHLLRHRRYNGRWCVERLFAWLQWFRRLVTRYKYHMENYSAWSTSAA
jgi:transposase